VCRSGPTYAHTQPGGALGELRAATISQSTLAAASQVLCRVLMDGLWASRACRPRLGLEWHSEPRPAPAGRQAGAQSVRWASHLQANQLLKLEKVSAFTTNQTDWPSSQQAGELLCLRRARYLRKETRPFAGLPTVLHSPQPTVWSTTSTFLKGKWIGLSNLWKREGTMSY